MSNLLPIPVIKSVRQIYMSRFLVAVSLLSIVAAMTACVLLLPSYLIVKRNRAASEATIAAMTAPGADDADKKLIAKLKLRIEELRPMTSASTSPSVAITAALAARPPGIMISRISYSKEKAGTVLLTGTSLSGDKISEYQRALSQSAAFSSVSVPVGALAGVNDGRFSITLIAK